MNMCKYIKEWKKSITLSCIFYTMWCLHPKNKLKAEHCISSLLSALKVFEESIAFHVNGFFFILYISNKIELSSICFLKQKIFLGGDQL